MITSLSVLLASTLLQGAPLAPERAPLTASRFSPDRLRLQRDTERALIEGASAARLGDTHEMLTDEPHVAGSEGDRRVIAELEEAFERMGLEVETHWIDVYLARPIRAELSIVAPEQVSLRVDEPPVDDDAWSADPRLDIGWNAYSGSGTVEGEVVYANRATLEDFQALQRLGVSCEGKIVVARYGGNFRGFKAKYAQEAGAAGLIIYTDPRDAGYTRGVMYPEGGWANEFQIQRGSIKTLPYTGDPLTPGQPATAGRDVERLDPETVDLPRIPVQPVGWGAASRILSRMTGPGVPEGWQGGLPFAYRVTGGADLRVRLTVEQERAITRTANVVATLRGEKHPDEQIVLGCHHDAWGFGAGDPNAGLMCLVECARVFAEAAGRGVRPARTIRFGAWGAEEFGIIGSTEWVEEHRRELDATCIAYINLDMAAMGPDFRASAAPTLKRLIVEASDAVPQAGAPDATVREYWQARSGRDATEPAVGTLGGGSDHVAFYCNLGIPSISLGAGGSRGVSYHSNVDDLAWYRKVVGDDYESALMITRMAAVIASRLANADVLPLDPGRYARDVPSLARRVVGPVDGVFDRPAWAELERECAELASVAGEVGSLASMTVHSNFDTAGARARLNGTLARLERTWTADVSGLDDAPERAFFRSRYVAPDPTSGYSPWMLPVLRRAVEKGDSERVDALLLAIARRVSIIRDELDRAGAEAGLPPVEAGRSATN